MQQRQKKKAFISCYPIFKTLGLLCGMFELRQYLHRRYTAACMLLLQCNRFVTKQTFITHKQRASQGKGVSWEGIPGAVLKTLRSFFFFASDLQTVKQICANEKTSLINACLKILFNHRPLRIDHNTNANTGCTAFSIIPQMLADLDSASGQRQQPSPLLQTVQNTVFLLLPLVHLCPWETLGYLIFGNITAEDGTCDYLLS